MRTSGNTTDLTTWLNSNGGATTDNRTNFTWSNNYSTAECEDLDGGLFLTYTSPNWGASNSNNAAAALLDADFATVFLTGVNVGCEDGYSIDFTTADAIDGTCLALVLQDLVLTHSGTNPTEAAVDPHLLGQWISAQLLVAKLNVAFDNADEDLGRLM